MVRHLRDVGDAVNKKGATLPSGDNGNHFGIITWVEAMSPGKNPASLKIRTVEGNTGTWGEVLEPGESRVSDWNWGVRNIDGL